MNNHEGRLKALEYQIELLRKMSAPTDGGPNMIEEMKALEDKLREEFDKKLDDLRARI